MNEQLLSTLLNKNSIQTKKYDYYFCSQKNHVDPINLFVISK